MEKHIKFFPYDIDEEKLNLAVDLVWGSQQIGATVLAVDIIASLISNDPEECENEEGKMGDLKSEGYYNDSDHPINETLDKMMGAMEVLDPSDVEKMAEEHKKKTPEEADIDEKMKQIMTDFNRWLYEVVKYPEPMEKRFCHEEEIFLPNMRPQGPSYEKCVDDNKRAIEMLKRYFQFRKRIPDKMHKSGRLNNTWIKAVLSDYKFPFTRDWEIEKQKITLMVDVSGSMEGLKLPVAKEAMIVFAEALSEVADIRIVLFCGTRDALNIVVKDFGEKSNPTKFNMIGIRQGHCENIDGKSLLYECEKNPKGIIIVFSDGQPAGSGYGLNDAVLEFDKARPKLKALFAFSIDARGEYLDKLYEKNYVIVSYSKPKEFIDKFLRLGRIIVDYMG